MKALFIGPNLAAGGAERQWSILLPGLRARGIDARLIALDAGGPFEAPLRAAGVPLEVLAMRNQADLSRLARSRLLRRFSPDVVVSRGVSGLYVGQLVTGLRRARHVYNEHRQVGLVLSRRREAMTSVVARRLDLVIVVSAEQAGAWRRRNFPAARIRLIANGVEPAPPPASRAQLREDLQIPPAAVVALLVARLRSEKRVPEFVRAVQRARESSPQLIGLIAGDGPDRPAVEAALAGDPSIRLLGHRDDVSRLLQAVDLFVLTSDFEALPMAILEAIAAGLPVLATRVGSVADAVLDGQTGRLVAAGDWNALARGLSELAGNADLRRRMGSAAASLHRERWQASAMIDGYAEVLASLCAPGAPGGATAGSTSAVRSRPEAMNRKL
jgi:glycosyltransferase involved in cell wall biosynthesis